MVQETENLTCGFCAKNRFKIVPYLLIKPLRKFAVIIGYKLVINKTKWN